MAVRYITQGLVFKAEDRFEADRAFSVFTQDFGRMEITGRGIRKMTSKLRGGMELFAVSHIEFIQGKQRKTLTDAAIIKRSAGIFEESSRVAVASVISELLDGFLQGSQHEEKIFRLLDFVFIRLRQMPAAKCQMLYHYFFWNFIAILGYAPQLSACTACANLLNPGDLRFSNKEGGVVCAACGARVKNAMRVSQESVKVLRIMLQENWDMLVKIIHKPPLAAELHGITESYRSYLQESHL